MKEVWGFWCSRVSMTKLERQSKKVKDKEAAFNFTKWEQKRIAQEGVYKLNCNQEYYSQVSPHQWVCYKYKRIKYFLGTQTKYIKYWYECEKCHYRMVIMVDQ